MKQTLTTSQAVNMLLADTDANWTDNGAHALVAYLEETEEDMGEDIEFDCCALRCDYSEYSSAIEAAKEYGYAPDDEEDEDEKEEAALAWLRDQTTCIEFDGGIIIQGF